LGREVVYASPVYGGAQIAIAHAARALGIRATIFAAERRVIHGRTAEALLAGARLVQVPHGYLTNVQAQARRYAELRGARLLPFGLDTPEALEAIAARARAAQAQTGPLAEVWCAGGSGVLCRGLQLGLAAAGPGGSRPAFHVVQVGARLGPAQAGCARVHVAPERFEDDARRPPPFPSCSNYDAKVWAEMGRSRGDGPILFWNVLG
jgi:threonine dehydratase